MAGKFALGPFDPLARLQDMRGAPPMWAHTCEGYAMQVAVVLDVMGIDGRVLLYCAFGSPNSAALTGLTNQCTVEFGHKVIDLALELIAKNNDNPTV